LSYWLRLMRTEVYVQAYAELNIAVLVILYYYVLLRQVHIYSEALYAVLLCSTLLCAGQRFK
jgi:hypothetical protein